MVYARRATRPKPITSTPVQWPAPTAGWVANRALASPDSIEGPGAFVLDNFFPRATGVSLRRGKDLYATLVENELSVTSLFTYRNGANEEMFGANENTIYDLSAVPFPSAQVIVDEEEEVIVTELGEEIGWGSTDGLEVSEGYTGGDWSVVQFATTGGIYLVGVNGEDTGFIYDGSEFWPNVAGGVWYLPLSAETTAFVEGETVTGGDSGATATVYRDDTTQLVLTGIVEQPEVYELEYSGASGTFTVGSTLTGADSNASATIDGDDGTTLTLSGLTGSFQNGETVEDGAGVSATAVGSETLVSGGPFQSGEALTGDVAGDAVAGGTVANAVPGMDFGSFTSADMSFVWSYKNRLWFVQKDSLTAWYLPIDSIGGTLSPFPMGGVFSNGGALLFGARWSLESGGDGGLSDQNVFVTTAGEAAIYQGDSPDEAETWNLVGVYRIGTPLGKRAYMRGGGDLAIATTVGLVPLSKAISLDVTALNVATVSYRIADAWTDAIRLRGNQDWQAMIWPENKLAAISPPDLIGSSAPIMFISNTETGAWARYTNWHGLCMAVYRGQLYFGSPDGKVFQANVGGQDDGETYTGAVVPLFNDLGSPSQLKVSTVAKATVRSNAHVVDRVSVLSDFNDDLPPAPDATSLTGENVWGDGVWGTSVWGAEEPDFISMRWRSAGASGYKLSPCYQITSGSVSPLDAELIEIETLHQTGTPVS